MALNASKALKPLASFCPRKETACCARIAAASLGSVVSRCFMASEVKAVIPSGLSLNHCATVAPSPD